MTTTAPQPRAAHDGTALAIEPPTLARGLCRCCGAALTETFADLGMTPLANSFIPPDQAARMEPFYPLHALVCSNCRLVQLAEFESPQAIFSHYPYFSSVSESWLRHAEAYAEAMAARFRLGPRTPVVEVASNDGYLLQHFARRGIPVLGVDPAANVAQVAIARGVPTEVAFFGAATARRLRAAHPAPALVAANNVLAHVPELHDFVEGFRILLAPGGVATFEFPHLLRLVERVEFDTIYHEHFSYLSLLVAELIFGRHGLVVFDVEELPTHGGSLRLFVRHVEDASKPVTPAVARVRTAEQVAGLDGPEAYRRFASRVVETKCALLDFLIRTRRAGQLVVGYGAPAKGNTLLNYCGVGPELLPFTVDLSPHKQGLLLPGTRIPVRPPEAIREERPDYVLVLPWNLRDEIARQLSFIRNWGGRFVVPIPTPQVF
jgi:SAM-dependent methyltransferase